MWKVSIIVAVLVGHSLHAAPTRAAEEVADAATLARGRYLVSVSGCNDCHTPGYMQANGKVDEQGWLVGTPIGFKGPWGTSYAANLRLLAARLDEQAWLARTITPMRPPMPWFALQAMTVDDRRAIYHYLRHLGPAGVPAPAFVLPGYAPTTPVIVFEPVAPPTLGAPLASAARE